MIQIKNVNVDAVRCTGDLIMEDRTIKISVPIQGLFIDGKQATSAEVLNLFLYTIQLRQQ